MLANKENVVVQNRANPKTPGPSKTAFKTPFKLPLNDENAAGATVNPKKNLFAGKDPAKFVTPSGPRRPALTGKTTNAKARLNAPTPDHGGKSIKGKQQAGARPVRPRISISEQVKPVVQEEDDDVPEIEYMPPNPEPLPDIPDGYEPIDFEALKRNIMIDCHRNYLADVDEDGKTKLERAMEENYREREAELDAETEAILNDRPRRDYNVETIKPSRFGSRRVVPLKEAPEKKNQDLRRPGTSASMRRPGTADSRKAASLLSQRPASSASTNSSLAKKKGHTRALSSATTATNKRPLSFSRNSAAPLVSSSRDRAVPSAAATSKTSIGYKKGREVQKTVKKHWKDETAAEACERIMREDDERFGPLEDMTLDLPTLDIDDEIIAAEDSDLSGFVFEDDEAEVFQITMPEGL